MRERLAVTLRLHLGATVHEIPGGNVRKLALSMTAYGVEGALEFVLQDDKQKGGKYQDKVLADFVKTDLGKVELSIQALRQDTTIPPEKGKIVTGGLVLEKQVEEHVVGRVVDAPSVLARRYRVTFCDPARAMWRQHFPCDLFTNRSFADAITAHQGLVQIKFDWDVIRKPAPLIFFHLAPDRGASFYDLVVWYVRSRQGVFTFDQTSQSYSIAAVKSVNGTPSKVPSGDLAVLSSTFAEVPRHNPRVRCSYTEAATTTTLANVDASRGVFRDVLLRTPIAQEVDDRAALEKSRPLARSREVAVSFGRFPTESVLPNAIVTLPGGAAGGPLSTPTEFRVTELEIDARALADDLGNPVEVNYGEPSTDFELSVGARLETRDERSVRLPSFTAPHFPGQVEGKVVSEVGADDELTYQLYPDQATSVDEYRVKIPLFQDQIVTAPYEPYSGAGTLYLPLYKGERVLAAFEFDRVRIRELLDWRGEARVPLSGQGQQLFLGKTAKDNTSVLHDYQGQKPVFRILRTNQNDTAFFRLEEGKMTLKVEEKAGG
jgi:hypothetical protein